VENATLQHSPKKFGKPSARAKNLGFFRSRPLFVVFSKKWPFQNGPFKMVKRAQVWSGIIGKDRQGGRARTQK
jgi:hypothetical protein